jgi:hypothetical protein
MVVKTAMFGESTDTRLASFHKDPPQWWWWELLLRHSVWLEHVLSSMKMMTTLRPF